MTLDAHTAPSSLLADYLSPSELARWLGISRRTLDRLHSLRQGPPRTAIGRKVIYRLDAVREWLRAREMGPLIETTRKAADRGTPRQRGAGGSRRGV
jgi:predicted DNA-binding transcriptional regulator AlpA